MRTLTGVGAWILCVFLAACSREGDTADRAATPGPEVTADAVRAHVMALASDALEGRGAGYAGEAKAAAYIEQRFREAGLETSIQTFRFAPRSPERAGDVLVSRNVLAVLPGSAPTLRLEAIMLGAHYDGQGRAGQADGGRLRALEKASAEDAIWNSADDNASSVAAVLEIARVLAQGSTRPKRTIIFAAFGAEEHALNGSAHLADNPWPAGIRVGAMVNVEKIGRVPEQPLIMAGCSSSSAWAELRRRTQDRTGQDVECLLPELIPDTDHYPFAAVGIPAVVLGIAHEEDTHRPTDDPWRLDFEALARRAAYVRQLVEILAGIERLPPFDPAARRGTGLMVVTASESERSALNMGDHGALKVSALMPGLPAASAGIRVGEMITMLDDRLLEPDVQERVIHERVAANGRADVTIQRGRELISLTLTEERNDEEN